MRNALLSLAVAALCASGCQSADSVSSSTDPPDRDVQGRAQSNATGGPPIPFEDIGACPFEGCVYQEWIANSRVTLKTDRRNDAPEAFTLEKGEPAFAITGIVTTLKPGRVQFREAIDLRATDATVHVEPGETLHLLTYHGEGFTTAWFNGRLYEELDGSDFFNGACDIRPEICKGTIVERPEQVWWVRLERRGGGTGWTSEPDKFDNKDALGQ